MVHSIQFIFWLASSLIGAGTSVAFTELEAPIVFVQIPVGLDIEERPLEAEGMLRADYGDGARLVLLRPDRKTVILTKDFASALDPEISFDGTRILFSGKRSPSDRWNIFEMCPDGSGLHQITRDLGDCRTPIYQSTLYTIISTEPWYQIAFTSNVDNELNECGSSRSTSLYSCKLDGSEVRRLTYNISSDMDPFLLPDGRILLASWQRATLDHGPNGRIPLFTVNLDGTDFSLFSSEGKSVKLMPCMTAGGLVVFVESERLPWEGSGQLASVSLRRNLHSYQRLTQPEDGLFHSPSPLPDGSLLVARRPSDNTGSHGIYRLDPHTGERELIFDDPSFHEIQAKIMLPRDEPDGRSSVVTEEDAHGQLYCLNSELSDLEASKRVPAGTVKRLRVLEGIPRRSDASASSHSTRPKLLQRRLLGEIPVEDDGSFFIEIPANIPIQLQTLDENGMALRSCGWIWVKNHEPRGCIGCHEDGELTPENRLVDAVRKAPYTLTLPEHRRRSVDFKRHVAPLVAGKCAAASCHARAGTPLKLEPKSSPSSLYSALMTSGHPAKYVHPGQARTSPLIWHVFGHDTSRPWDSIIPFSIPSVSSALSAQERRVLVEWIDMGASWDGREVPGTESGAIGGSGGGE